MRMVTGLNRLSTLFSEFKIMKPLALIIVLALALAGCNNLNDLRPVDPGTEIPEATVKVVKDKFPKAEDLVFKPILANKIWEVKLKSDADRYSSLVDYGKMWETFKLVPDSVPQSLKTMMSESPFSGGELSAYSKAYFATTAANKLIYNYKGENYSLLLDGLVSFDQNVYRITTYEIDDLPAFVKDTIRAAPNMGFSVGYTWVRFDDSKRYFVFARQNINNRYETVSMLFDDKGKLGWSSTAFTAQGMVTASSNLDPLPPQIIARIESLPELTGFEYYLKLKNDVNGLTSYYVKLRKANTYTECELYFDKDFNVLYKKYFVR